MSSVNKVILIGNLGRTPELKPTVNNKMYCFLSIATSEQWKDKATGEKREATTWHNVKVYEPLASICTRYSAKGDKVYVEGYLKNGEYERKGEKIKTTDIVASKFIMISSKNETTQLPSAEVDHNKTTAFDFLNDDVPF